MALLDKDVVAGAHAAYLRGDGAPLLALMDEEMYDNVSQRSGGLMTGSIRDVGRSEFRDGCRTS